MNDYLKMFNLINDFIFINRAEDYEETFKQMLDAGIDEEFLHKAWQFTELKPDAMTFLLLNRLRCDLIDIQEYDLLYAEQVGLGDVNQFVRKLKVAQLITTSFLQAKRPEVMFS